MDGDAYWLEEDALFDIPDNFDHSPVAPLAAMSEMARKEYWAILALRHATGIGLRTQNKLLRHFGGAFTAMQNIRLWPRIGITAARCNAAASGGWREAAKMEWEKAKIPGIKILLWNNAAYPACLRQLPDAPILLYCKGDINLLKSPCIGIVGSRNPLPQNLELTNLLAMRLSACGITVVSGMALGIDRAAHAGALREIGSSIGVLGAGINCVYPWSNKDLFQEMNEKGLLLSEFSPSTAPAATNFPIRNRIISGLSLGIVVIEAAERSGSLITARLALEQNREIFALPGQPLSSQSLGCQNLIRQGAHPVFSVDDILKELAVELNNFHVDLENPQNEQPAPPRAAKKFIKRAEKRESQNESALPQMPPEDDEAAEIAGKMLSMPDSDKILACLRQHGVMDVEALMAALGMSAQTLSSSLLLMEMRQKIKRLPGARYEAVDDGTS